MTEPEPTARQRLIDAMASRTCFCGADSCQNAAQYVDAYAHQLAEQIRNVVPPTAITPGGPYTDGQMFAADLIDPETEDPQP
jgi:hypothetical protein